MYGVGDSSDISIFSPFDEDILEECRFFAMKLKESRSYVNLSKAKFRCLVCNEYIDQEADIVIHATNTGHQNFGQAEQT